MSIQQIKIPVIKQLNPVVVKKIGKTSKFAQIRNMNSSMNNFLNKTIEKENNDFKVKRIKSAVKTRPNT